MIVGWLVSLFVVVVVVVVVAVVVVVFCFFWFVCLSFFLVGRGGNVRHSSTAEVLDDCCSMGARL